MSRAPRPVRAAGGVVWREVEGVVEVAVVHRDRYDDWSLPKGKVEDGEDVLLAAVREVREETGALVRVGAHLGRIHYDVPARSSHAGPKTVDYWAMRETGGRFVENDEVDELTWVPLVEVQSRLSYATERTVVQRFASTVRPDAVVVLVRHARAGKRSAWDGPDALRPLDKYGRLQARRLAPLLACFGPTGIRSADRVRCEQTAAPLAAAIGLDVLVDRRFSDDAVCADVASARDAVLELARTSGTATVIASQGGAIPALIDILVGGYTDPTTRKGAFWVLGLRGALVVSCDLYEDATRRGLQNR